MTELKNRLPHQLSGGQQQRVALARILVSDPRILLLDEPFSALDSHLRFKLEREVRQVIREFGKTVVLVSHDRDEVFRMADWLAIMNEGSIEALGSKKEVFQNPETRRGAILTGCKNISQIEVLGPGLIWATDWDLQLETRPIPEGTTAVGIRMHAIRPSPGKNSYRCRMVEEIENPFSYTIMLKPLQGNSTGLIGWEMDKESWKQIRSTEIGISLPPEALLLLKD